MKDYYILKEACRKIYFAGGGNFWFEEGVVGNDQGFLYQLYSKTMFMVYIFITILEIIAVLNGDFPYDENSDATTFSLSHTIVLIKLTYIILQKDVVKSLNRDVIGVCEKQEDFKLMETKSNLIRINVVAYFCAVYGSALFFVCEGLRKLCIDGTHFVTVVTYYPSFEDNSLNGNLFRIFGTIVLYMMLLHMIAVDSLAVTFLISIKYKFITLRNYFGGLEDDFNRNKKSTSIEEASKDLRNKIVDGIVMHQELLRVTKNVEKTFGFPIALQVCQSFTSVISLLLQLALNDQLSFTSALKLVLFILGLLFLLALFLCNTGEITHQASLLSDSIFYCGWHACSGTRSDIGKLVLQSFTIAQQPLIMKPFQMLHLSYGTFLSVVRGVYSVFALIYAQKKE